MELLHTHTHSHIHTHSHSHLHSHSYTHTLTLTGGAATGPTGYASYGVHKGTTSGGGGGGGFKAGGADKCPRCGGSVYAAEKVVGAGKVHILVE